MATQLDSDRTSSLVLADRIEIRPLGTSREFQACLDLQLETWGDAPGTIVPTALLLVAQRIGGVSAGAFASDGRLLGFVFGLTGIERGELVHWSDMLAVRPEARDRGLGRRLKAYQREQVARLGVRTIYWTYDPLVAKNAYLNLEILGARAAQYIPDMYGDTGSSLHAGLGTDRIVVAWDIQPNEPGQPDEARLRERRRNRGVGAHDTSGAMVLDPDGREFVRPGEAPTCVAIEIPMDIFAVRERSAEEARRWRMSTRAALMWAMGHGYDVVGVERDALRARARYVLVRRRERTR